MVCRRGLHMCKEKVCEENTHTHTHIYTHTQNTHTYTHTLKTHTHIHTHSKHTHQRCPEWDEWPHLIYINYTPTVSASTVCECVTYTAALVSVARVSLSR